MKPNSFTRLYVHYVFTPRGRLSLLKEPLMEKIQKYIYGIIKKKKCNPIALNGTEDHIHILIGLSPSISVSDFIRDIKRSSALFVNSELPLKEQFRWQDGYGAFTVGYRELDKVYKYILDQKNHHARFCFKEEYMNILKDEGFEDFEDYLFEFYD